MVPGKNASEKKCQREKMPARNNASEKKSQREIMPEVIVQEKMFQRYKFNFEFGLTNCMVIWINFKLLGVVSNQLEMSSVSWHQCVEDLLCS